MTIKKFQGKTKEEVLTLARQELGPSVVIMNVREVRPRGPLGLFGRNTFEVTAAIEDDAVPSVSFTVDLSEEGETPEEPMMREEEARIPATVRYASHTVTEPSKEAVEPLIPDTARASEGFSVVSSVKSTGNFQALADEKIVIPPVTREEASAAPALPSLQEQQALKEAFAAVNQVIAKQDFTPLSQVEKVENITGAYEPPKESKPREFEPKESKPREFEAKESKPRVSASKEHKPRELEPKESKPREAVIKKSEPREMPHREVVPESLGKGAARESFSEEQQTFFKMVYKVLMEQEVSEIYINQLLDDMERASKSTDGLQFLIANTYQKMILKLGKLQPIVLAKKRPKVVFFIGPTGVGKTTTIAKIASKFKLEQEKKVALLTADTYRIAAAEQLRTYANILDIPLSVVYTPEDIGREVEAVADCDLILVDTAGFSHKNDSQREDMQTLLESLPEEYERDIYLVLSATTKYKDLVEITDSYQAYCRFALIFTKLDETGAYGNIYNIRMHTQAPLSYITTGQNVPDDMEEVDTQKLVKQLLGGK